MHDVSGNGEASVLGILLLQKTLDPHYLLLYAKIRAGMTKTVICFSNFFKEVPLVTVTCGQGYLNGYQKSSINWREGKHYLKPWWEYSLGILMSAYSEFEKRAGAISTSRGSKTALVEETIRNLPSTFRISDIARLSPTVSRDMIRVILNRLRNEGALQCKSTGRSALWEKRGNRVPKQGNKRGNNT